MRLPWLYIKKWLNAFKRASIKVGSTKAALGRILVYTQDHSK
jgi:hypothetical protein